jgi:hypothetical protein
MLVRDVNAKPFSARLGGRMILPLGKRVHFINPGSAGRMFDGDPRVSFAALDISSGDITVEHFRVSYPVEETVKGLKDHKLPDIYARMFREGRKLN